MKIIKVKNEYSLYCKYDRQSSQQPCYVELDCREGGSLEATYNGEIGNAIPFYVYHNHAIRFNIPCLTGSSVNDLLEEIKPLAEIVINGYDKKWNGNNFIGNYTDEANNAIEKIQKICDDIYVDESNSIIAWEAGDYLDEVISRIDIQGNQSDYNNAVKVVCYDSSFGEITHETSDIELKNIEQNIEKQIDSNVIINHLYEFLENERNNCIENYKFYIE